MPPLFRRRYLRTLAFAAACALVAVLFLVQLQSARDSAGRRVGVVFGETEAGLVIDELAPDAAAIRGGLRLGDRLLTVNGTPIAGFVDYDRAAAAFTAGRPAFFAVERDRARRILEVVPGSPVGWPLLVVKGLLILCLLAMAAIVVSRLGDLRARLLFLLLALMAAELAIPEQAIGMVVVGTAAQLLGFLLNGAQMSVELHLAAVIPERRRWLAGRPWLVPIGYGVGLGLALAASAVYLAEELRGWVFPWAAVHPETLLIDLGLPVWAVLVVVILATTVAHHGDARGRAQAGLILLGVVPWVVYVFGDLAISRFDAFPDLDLAPLLYFSYLAYAGAAFLAVIRYQLFDIRLVVRRSLLYTVLTTALVLVFYAALGAGGALFSRLFPGGENSVWVVAASTLLLGLFFAPLRRAVERLIDRRFFPEGRALRRQLIDLARELPALGELPRMARRLTAGIREMFDISAAALLIADPESGVLHTLATKRRDGTGELPLLLPADDPGIARLRRLARPLEVRELAAASPSLARQLEELRAALLVPLLSQDHLVGVLALGRRASSPLSAEEKELLALFAQHAATVIENVRLFASATYDNLTGLRRRETILEILEREIARARRHRRPLSVALADLDHFKEVNDRYGHLTGDAVLKRVAEELERGLRRTDAVGRYGGEEFLLVLPETDAEQAAKVAEAIRRRVAALSIPMADGSVIQVRVSIGLTDIEQLRDDQGEPARALLSAADEALYRAKDAGRDQVVSGTIDTGAVAPAGGGG